MKKTLLSAGVLFAAANLALADIKQEAVDEANRLAKRQQCLDAYANIVKSADADDSTKVLAAAPRYTEQVCGPSQLSKAISDVSVGSIAEAIFDPFHTISGRDLVSAVDALRNPSQMVAGRDLDEAVGSAAPIIDFLSPTNNSIHQYRNMMINSGQWDPYNYPGRDLVPSTNNPQADKVIGQVVDFGSQIALQSPNPFVKAGGIVAPALVPGRDLGQRYSELKNDPFQTAAHTGLAAGEAVGFLGRFAPNNWGEDIAAALGNEAAQRQQAAREDGLGDLGRGIDAKNGVGNASLGRNPYNSTSADTRMAEVPQAVITISIPTFVANASSYPNVQSHMAPDLPSSNAEKTIQPQTQYSPLYNAPNNIGTLAGSNNGASTGQNIAAQFTVQCEIRGVTSFAKSVDDCEDVGGLIIPLSTTAD